MRLRLPGRQRPPGEGPCRVCREHVDAEDVVGLAPLRFCSAACERWFCGREVLVTPFVDG